MLFGHCFGLVGSFNKLGRAPHLLFHVTNFNCGTAHDALFDCIHITLSWNILDPQRHSDHNKYLAARVIIEAGFGCVFLDTDDWLERRTEPSLKNVYYPSDKSKKPDVFLGSLAYNGFQISSSGLIIWPYCLQGQGGYRCSRNATIPLSHACTCTCVMFFEPTGAAKLFLHHIIHYMDFVPNAWEQDLASKLLPLHVQKGLTLELGNMELFFNPPYNITKLAKYMMMTISPEPEVFINHGLKLMDIQNFCKEFSEDCKGPFRK